MASSRNKNGRTSAIHHGAGVTNVILHLRLGAEFRAKEMETEPRKDTGKPLFLIARVTNSEQSPETQAPRAGALYARYETEGRRSCAPDKAERVFGIRNNRAPLIFLRKLPSQPVPPLI